MCFKNGLFYTGNLAAFQRDFLNRGNTAEPADTSVAMAVYSGTELHGLIEQLPTTHRYRLTDKDCERRCSTRACTRASCGPEWSRPMNSSPTVFIWLLPVA